MNNPFKNIFTENEQKVLLFIIVIAFIGISIEYSGLIAENEKHSPTKIDLSKDHQIKYDLMKVTHKELQTIPGIGPKTASNILDHRNTNDFRNKKELMNVKGIGKKTYEKIEAYFYDFGANTKDTKKSSRKNKININKATLEELQEIKGIGPAKAERIIEYRTKISGFNSLNELLEVKGIGPKTLERIKKTISLGD